MNLSLTQISLTLLNLKPYCKINLSQISIMQNIKNINPIKIDMNFEEINIKGLVEIINGDSIIKANNKFVQSMLAWYANMTSINYTSGGSSAGWYLGTYLWKMYLGTDTITTTNYNTTALTSPIGATPGRAPDTTNGSVTNPSNGVFNIIFTATWGTNTVSGTVGEMALYLSIRGTRQSFGWVNSFGPTMIETNQLVSRLAVADGTFSPFTINTANPLTINWTTQLSFS